MSDSWVFWALLSAAFAAATAVLAKAGSDGIDPDLATLVRTAVVLVCLLVLVTATGKWNTSEPLPRRTVALLVLSGFATGASWVCYFRALKAGEVSKVAPVDKLSVVLVAVFAVVFLRERLGVREWTGIGLVTAGVVVLVLKR
ncbi:EamA family transporter [Gemmata sp. G18]|uniref:EamA family transporter n=1 Tax=Gemmata palustris TaxID=2822762 RepID=A0ABS5BLF2_9BACT|nr:EamA family transporter [Gemmata palustris]MBP3954312.1 EamA family transporter [Gemmata palustris]